MSSFCDLSKAFGVINYDILIKNLILGEYVVLQINGL